jgi:hypothetical protein
MSMCKEEPFGDEKEPENGKAFFWATDHAKMTKF